MNAGPQDQLCSWVTTVWANRKGKVFFKVLAESCGPVPAPFDRARWT